MKAVTRKNDSLAPAPGGFTVIEVLVAITVLLITAVAFVPLFVFIAEGSQANRARLTAANLATTAVEQIRAMSYVDVGTAGGNPPGNIQRTRTVTVSGMDFTITTDITWVDDPSDDPAMGSDPIPYDYKKVRVTVSAPGIFNGSAAIIAELETLVAMEGEEEAYPGGNLRAEVIRGWDHGSGQGPAEGVQVELASGPDAPQTLWTDEGGRALFAVLHPGTYTVEVDPSGIGMMVRPGQSPRSEAVAEGANTETQFEVEVPGRLALELKDASTGLPAATSGTATLIYPPPMTGQQTVIYTTGAGGVVPNDLFGNVWPVGDGYAGSYGLVVSSMGYKTYKLEEAPEPKWDGEFSRPGESLTAPVSLIPVATVVVIDSGGSPVPGAAVEAFRRTYTYSGSAWAFSDGPPAPGTTDQQGVCRLALPDNNPPPPPPLPPQSGSTFSLYCVRVSVAGSGPVEIPDAFWVQWDEGSEDRHQYHTATGARINSFIIVLP